MIILHHFGRKRHSESHTFLVKSYAGEEKMRSDAKSSRLVIKNSKVFEVTALTGAYHFATKPDFVPYWECYDFSQMMLILTGTGRFHTEQGSYAFGPGMMLYRPAYRKTMYEWDGEKGGLAIIDFVCESSAMDGFPTEPIPLLGEESAALFDLVKIAARACTAEREHEVPEVVFSYLCSSLERFLAMVHCRLAGIDRMEDEGRTVSRSLDESRFVGEIRAFLAEHVTEQLMVSDVCARFWIGQTALMRKFRHETGHSLMEYFMGLKIAEAQRRIGTGTATFTEISEALGFSSVNYFSKVFKQKTGMTPTEYSRYLSRCRVGEE